VKAAKTADRGRGNKTRNQRVIGASRYGMSGLWRDMSQNDADKAGQTRATDAVFPREGGIIFLPKARSFSCRSAAKLFAVFFRGPLP
jgi:hypothetical protein